MLIDDTPPYRCRTAVASLGCRQFLGLMNGLPHLEHLILTLCPDALSHKAFTCSCAAGTGGGWGRLSSRSHVPDDSMALRDHKEGGIEISSKCSMGIISIM